MNLNDLKILSKPLYFKAEDFTDLSAYMFSETNEKSAFPILIKELCKINYPHVYDLIEGEKDSIDDAVLRNLFKKNKLKEYHAPVELQARLYVLKENTNDFNLYPTFYSQEFLDIIKYYTIERDETIKSPYTYIKLAEKIFECDLTFVDSINLKTPGNDCGKGLGEIFIHGAGVAIMPKEFLESMSSRELINSLQFKEGVGLNAKLDGRKLLTRNSILDWRERV